jgi:uncharacterized Fe-S cluster-containing radical SAM superfamily enzyme
MCDYISSWAVKNSTSKYSPVIAQNFKDRLDFDHMYGYRAGRAIFKSATSGRTFYMFLRDFEEVIKSRLFIDNAIDGEFQFIKKGQAQGIKLIINKTP